MQHAPVQRFGAAKEGKTNVVLYSNIACPFAHRSFMTLLEKGIGHDFVKIPLSGELKAIKANGVESVPGWKDSGLTGEQIQEIKDSYIATVNSTGEVPTLAMQSEGEADRIVREADVISEFLDDAFPESGTRLFPTDAFKRAQTRHYLKVLGGPSGVSGHYGCLMNQDPSKDEEKRAALYKGLATFCEMADADGPFFLGAHISFADVMLAPFFDRMRFVLPHYRGIEYIPSDGQVHPWAARIAAWAKAIESTPSFQQSSYGEAAVPMYKGYAGDRGASIFAIA